MRDLLRDLQAALPADERRALHRRAARWYADASQAGPARSSGEQTDFVREAIHHTLAAEEYALAVQLLEKHAIDMLMQWHVKTLDGWLQAIPPEWAAQSPHTNLAFIWMYLLRGAFDQAAPYVARLQTIFAGHPGAQDDPDLRAEWLALQCMLLRAQGQLEASLAAGQQALALLSEQAGGHVYSMTYLGLSGVYQQLGDFAQARDAFQHIIEHARASGDLVAELMGFSGLALMVIERGQLHYGFELAAQGVQRAQQTGWQPPILTGLYGELAQVYYQWGQLEQAHTYFERAIQAGALSGYSDPQVYYAVVRSRLALLSGDVAAAGAALEQALAWAQASGPVVVREELLAQQVRVYLAQGRPAAAEAVLQGTPWFAGPSFALPTLPGAPPVGQEAALLYNSALRIRVYRAQAGQAVDLPAGLALADRVAADMLARQNIQVTLETLLLRAQLHDLQGNKPAAWADRRQALELGEPEGFVSAFTETGPATAAALRVQLAQAAWPAGRMDYVRRILAAFPNPQPSGERRAPAEPVEPLTEREREVLYWMAAGLKYAEIAERLFVSVNTVRTHVKGIYGKLNVNNRTQALALARQLDWIASE